MKTQGIDGYLVLSADEHINEYLPAHTLRREFLSGFNGSAGDMLITQNNAWLFVDSRYHEQADYQVDTSVITLSKLGQANQPTLSEQVKTLTQANPNFKLGFDPFCLPVATHQQLHKLTQLAAITPNLVDALWTDRPKAILETVYNLPVKYTGQSTADKLKLLRQSMAHQNIDILPLIKLDQIAWLLNWRGQDIPYNPVFLAYAIVTAEQLLVFCEKKRMTATEPLAEIHPYTHYASVFSKLAKHKRVLIDPKHMTYGTVNLLHNAKAILVEQDNPVELAKAIKNLTEIKWMKQAHTQSGKGKIRLFHWLAQQQKAGKQVTEVTAAQTLESYYAQEPGYKGLSFNTISGAGKNSSIVHYGTPNPRKKLSAGALYLVDSGVQYLGGTTDDTRTIIIGKATALQKQRYTDVLKAHINCAMQIFPQGSNGAQLDAITRMNLWQQHLDFGHGTGHGVGAFLNVHEGPQSISKLGYRVLQSGMIVSIEPGYYKPGWGGIRLENLYLIVQDKSHNKPGWLKFECLTWIPFDKKLIDLKRLTPEQFTWLTRYHQQILKVHRKTLTKSEYTWLENYCQLS